MRFKIDLRIFLFLILFYFTKQIDMYLMVLVFAIIHEMGHLCTGILLGMKPEKIRIMPMGVSISFRIKPNDYNIKVRRGNMLEIKKIIVAMAGPITNILMIIITEKLNLDIFTYMMIVFSNFAIFVFNLIPVYPMDGGRILASILYILFGKKRAIDYVHRISLFSMILITIITSILILYIKNIAIILAIAYLWYVYIMEDKHYKVQKNIYEIIENY